MQQQQQQQSPRYPSGKKIWHFPFRYRIKYLLSTYVCKVCLDYV
jgi:hypothetical protein